MRKVRFAVLWGLVVGSFALGGAACTKKEKSPAPAATEPPAPAAAIPAPAKDEGSTADVAVSEREVEAGCGQCQFGLEGGGCDLAVRIDGKAYWVDGTGIDEHGDAHADDGFCNAIRSAKVSGTIHGDRFEASSFKLVPEPGDAAKAAAP